MTNEPNWIGTHSVPNLPQESEALYRLLADVLTALHQQGEAPKLEEAKDWRVQYADHTPGIRRTAENGRWRRMVEWTNASGEWRWTYVGGE